jgi:hypothetical protein
MQNVTDPQFPIQDAKTTVAPFTEKIAEARNCDLPMILKGSKCLQASYKKRI